MGNAIYILRGAQFEREGYLSGIGAHTKRNIRTARIAPNASIYLSAEALFSQFKH